MTIKLDLKDRKILKELFENARKPFAEIAGNVRLSKEVVNYRVNRLLESGLLTGFNTVIDIRRLGWELFFVYVRLRNIDSAEEKVIIGELKGHPNAAWVVRCIGNYDIILKMFAKDVEEVNGIMKDFETRHSAYVDHYAIEYIAEEHAVPFSFIYESEKDEIHAIKKASEKRYELDEIERKMLGKLRNNARMALSDMSRELGISRDLLSYHLKKLEKENVILKYRPDLWPDKIGYSWYFIVLKLGKMDAGLAQELNAYLLNQKNVTYFYKTVGERDIEIEVRVRDTDELSVILMELRSILKTVLKRHEIMIILKEYKYTYFPDCMANG